MNQKRPDFSLVCVWTWLSAFIPNKATAVVETSAKVTKVVGDDKRSIQKEILKVICSIDGPIGLCGLIQIKFMYVSVYVFILFNLYSFKCFTVQRSTGNYCEISTSQRYVLIYVIIEINKYARMPISHHIVLPYGFVRPHIFRKQTTFCQSVVFSLPNVTNWNFHQEIFAVRSLVRVTFTLLTMFAA